MPYVTPRFAPLLTLLIDGMLMAIIMSGALTAINTGIDDRFISRWFHAFMVAFPVALLASSLVVPLGRHLVTWLTENKS